MAILSKTGSYSFLVEPFHCDFSHRLFMGHLGNHLLNAADFHSNERGYGMDYLSTVHRTWVLSRFVIEMSSMPRAYKHINIETWVEDVMKYFTSRDFKVIGKDDTVLGYGRSIWAMIDTETRQPVDILDVRDGLINEYIEKTKQCPIAPFTRVRIGKDIPMSSSVKACYSDVDINGHVNSVKYIEHILDLWDIDWYRSHSLKRLEIAYIAEAHYGDTLSFFCDEERDGVFSVRVMKETDGVDGAKEVCRCRAEFC